MFAFGKIWTKIRGDLPELFEGGFEVFEDSLGKHVRIGRLPDASRLSSLGQKMSRPVTLPTYL